MRDHGVTLGEFTVRNLMGKKPLKFCTANSPSDEGDGMGKGEGDSGRGSAREGGIEWAREGRGGERTIEETAWGRARATLGEGARERVGLSGREKGGEESAQ